MKLQSAIEYLTTYGWAILILSIVGVAIFAIISSSSNAVQECTLPAGFACPSFYISQNGLLYINLIQSTQNPIQVTAIGCTNPQSESYMTTENSPPSNYIYMAIGSNYTFNNVYCYSNGTVWNKMPIKSVFSGYLEINYTNAYTGFPNTVYGTIMVESSS